MTQPDPLVVEPLVAEPLRALRRNLVLAHAGIVVTIAALRHQRAERDEDIAAVLDHWVGEHLRAEIERAGALLESLSRWQQSGPAAGRGETDEIP